MSIAQFVTDEKTAIKILKVVHKEVIRPNTDYYICNQLYAKGKAICEQTTKEILDYIDLCINTEENTLSCWVYKYHPEFYKETFNNRTYRKAWIDVMIKQLKEVM